MNQKPLREFRREMVGEVLREIRTERGLSQQGLADLLGCTLQAISHWERGLHLPSRPALLDISERLGVEVARRLFDAIETYRERVARRERSTGLQRSTALQQLRA